MGYQATCKLRFEGRTTAGTALLESAALVVRGPVRLSVPLASVTEVTTVDGWLRVRFADRTAEIALGDQASRWATRIANPRTRSDKLGVKPGMRLLAIGAVDEAFLEESRAIGATVEQRHDAANLAGLAPFDLVFYAVDRPDALEALRSLVPAIIPAGAIWTLRTKGHATITEAGTMAAGKRAGLVDVKVVSFSATTTAEKFVIPVGKRPGKAIGAVPSAAPGRRAR